LLYDVAGGPTHPIASVNVPYGAPVPFIYNAVAPGSPGGPVTELRCLLTSFDDVAGGYDLTVSYESNVKADELIATFDTELLGIMIAHAVVAAGLTAHVETSSDGSPKTVISWSQTVADLIGAPNLEMNIADVPYDHFGLKFRANFDVLPPGELTATILADGSAPALNVRLGIQGGSTTLVAVDSSIDLDKIDITVDLANSLFDFGLDLNTGRLSVVSGLSATLNVAGFGVLDVTEAINSKLQDKLASGVGNPAMFRSYVNVFFANLLRLPGNATIVGYTIDSSGQTITVTYIQPLLPPVVVGGGHGPVADPGPPLPDPTPSPTTGPTPPTGLVHHPTAGTVHVPSHPVVNP
jgi:hypothetical protein